MVLGEGEIPQHFGTVRLVGGESLVSQRTLFSRDSKILFCSCGRRIRVYSTATGDLVRELRGHVGKVADFKINPKNHLQLVSCSSDGEVIYWDYTDGRILKRFKFAGFTLGGLLLHPAHNESIFLIIIKKDPTKGKRATTKEEKKERKRKAKYADIEDCSVGVFNPKDCKKASKSILNIFLETSGNSKRTTINGDGNLLASVQDKSLHVWNFSSEKLNTVMSDSYSPFTCASFHPVEDCVAAGDSMGRIIIWQGLDQLESPITMVLHWHPHAVGDVVFTHDGSNMLSGGVEGVLVRWQWKTHEQQFLPRLGAGINHITVSPDDSLTAISQKENIIRLISNIENKVQRTIQGLRQIDNLHMGVVFDPRSKALVTGNMPGVLQFYLPTTDHHALSLDVVEQNYIGKPKKENMIFIKIDHVAFSGDGGWLATVERRDDHKTAMELRLKFWEYNKLSQFYEPNTCIDPPHDKKIVALQFQPQQKKDHGVGPLAMTAGRDGKFKIWILGEDGGILKGNKYSWTCRSVGYYDDTPCQDAAFSQDGSLLAVAYDQTITLWTPETNELRKTLTLPYPDVQIKRIKFGCNNSSQYLISITNQYLTVWNLLSCSVWWSVEAPVTCLVTDPQTNLFCAFVSFNKNKAHMYIFDPASPRPVAVQATVSRKTDIVSAAFDPASLVSGSAEDETAKMSKLYFLSEKQELFTLDCEEPTSKERNVTLQASAEGPSVQQSEFLKIFGQPVTRKDEATSVNRVGKSVRGNPSSAVVKQLMQTPSHVLPSVTSLCSSFLQSLLVSKHTTQREVENDADNDASEDEDEAMEVDEDDSDSETPQATKGVSERVDSAAIQRQQPNAGDSSVLNNVDFSWLKADYFT